ncbi:MAG: carboxypeptidase-like regulatory domain-containing protein [Acidobacteriia bacterium]|nr:carboxypeptidase-like regulatory domain-containing protein [Terriglobia bacterium]
MKFIGVAVLIALFFAAFSAAQEAPGGTVEGVVINSVTGAGIAGASVVLIANRSTRYETTSDAAGHFKITGMAPGSYRADVKKDGFAPPSFGLNSLLSNPGLRVASDRDPVKVELQLTPLDMIAGRVLGPDGKPAAGVEVSVSPNLMAEVAVTDEEGRFALHDIRPGSYTLIARPPKSTQSEQAPQERSDGARSAMVTTYYPSVADQSLAQPIVVRGQGNTGGGYEIRMQTALVHGVRGIVLDEEGKPSPGAELTLVQIGESTPGPMGLGMRAGGPSFFALGMRREPSGVPEASTIAGKDGHFEFPAVRSGDWRINAVSDSAREARGTAGVRVDRSDVGDLEIHVATPFNLTGIIEWKGEDSGSQRVSNPQPLLGVVTLINPDGNEFVRTGFVESGGLLFENILLGRYQAIVKPGLSAQIFLGDYEVTGQTFPIAAGGPRLRVVLKTWSGTVRGTVEKGDGATVVLVPQRVEGVAIGQTVVCRAGGSFELSEVSPGDYYIAAFDHLDGFLSPSAAMLSLVPSRGKSVKVEERSTANITLSVIAAPR